MTEADENGAAADSGGPASLVCKNCGEPVKRCADFCGWGGWFHPGRLDEANAAHYCAGSSGPRAEPVQPEGEN